MSRSELIQQLRHALNLAESPSEEVVEFEIGDTAFSFDYTDEGHIDMAAYANQLLAVVQPIGRGIQAKVLNKDAS